MHKRVRFAWILSCIMGIETIVFRMRNEVSTENEKIGKRSNNSDDLNVVVQFW